MISAKTLASSSHSTLATKGVQNKKLNAATSVINVSCEFLYEVPTGMTFSLWNLQGVLRFHPGIPAEQNYSALLQVLIGRGFIEPVEGQPDVYRRTELSLSRKAWKIEEESITYELLWRITNAERDSE